MNKKEEAKKELEALNVKHKKRLEKALSIKDSFIALSTLQNAYWLNVTEKMDFIDKYIDKNLFS